MVVTNDFWETFNSSRCKTAMLIITFFIMFAFSISEALNYENAELHTLVIICVGYWAGRTSKAKENVRGL